MYTTDEVPLAYTTRYVLRTEPHQSCSTQAKLMLESQQQQLVIDSVKGRVLTPAPVCGEQQVIVDFGNHRLGAMAFPVCVLGINWLLCRKA